MSVWLAIPSKRPPELADPILKLWHERGYKIALWRDWNDCKRWPLNYAEFARTGERYPGYAIAVNALVKQILEQHADAEWIVTGGDDVEPDPNHSAEEIARQCRGEFRRREAMAFNLHHKRLPNPEELALLGTLGVMQCTGDRWGESEPWNKMRFPEAPAYIDRVCGSPWLGREFCRRAYGGNGPLWPGYFHMFVDAELQAVAQRLGILWQRRDLIHLHHHVHREGPAPVPEFLERAYSPEHWTEAEALFKQREAAGFPHHEPIP